MADATSPHALPTHVRRQASGGSNRSYKVLVVTNLWPTADDPGYGSFVQGQMESLRPLGVDYDVLFVNGRRWAWNYLRGIFDLRRRVAASRYDLIHAHFGLSGWVARFQRRVPVVVSFMGDDVLGRFGPSGRVTPVGRLFQLSSFILARRVSAVIVKTERMKAKLGLESAHVIPNGVDLKLFKPTDRAEARRILALDPEAKFALFPFDPAMANKRFGLVEEAVRLARPEIPSLEILQVTGVPLSRMPLYVNAADMLVLASYSEGSPNAVKEAMAVNLPVVSVDVGDVRELIGQTEGCYLVPSRGEENAARFVEVCRRGARTAGRERMARYAEENIAREIVAVYEAVLGKKGLRESV